MRGARCLLLALFAASVLAGCFATSRSGTHDERTGTLAPGGATWYHYRYDREVTLDYEVTARAGQLSAYVFDASQEEFFRAGAPFDHFEKAAREDTTHASASIVLPAGAYAVGLRCVSAGECGFRLAVDAG